MISVDQYETTLTLSHRRNSQIRVALIWGSVIAGVVATALFV